MKTILHEKFNKKITKSFDYEFEVTESGLHVIEIAARCRSEKQIGENETDDDDLRIEIDGRKFPKLDSPKRYFDSPAAFSGGQLHNLKKIVFFLIYFSKGKHILTFIPDREPILEEASIQFAGDKVSDIDLDINSQAEDGDRRPWITFALVDLPLKQMNAEIKTQRRFFDSDDVKLIIDGKTKRNPRNFFRKLWFWLGSFFKGEIQTESFDVALKTGLHYIEFHADRMPILYKVGFDFGTPTKRTPTVYDPEWTGDFWDDAEEMLLARLIYGEARDQSREAKIWVTGAIINRVKAGAWPDTIKEVIIQEDQYDPIKSSDKNYPYVIDPLRDDAETDKIAWEECYEIAKDIISGKLENPTEATHFHGKGVTKDWFLKNVVPQGRFLRKIKDTYFYWSPN